jgi:hypothetical protein
MRLAKRVSAEKARLNPLFVTATKADIAFHEAWDVGVAEFGVAGFKATNTYAQVLSDFGSCAEAEGRVFDSLQRFRKGETKELPALLAFLGYEGRFHRSGYLKGRVARAMKKLDWDEEFKSVLQPIVLASFWTSGREFPEFARLALRLSTPEFRKDIKRLNEDSRPWVRKRAARVCGQFES